MHTQGFCSEYRIFNLEAIVWTKNSCQLPGCKLLYNHTKRLLSFRLLHSRALICFIWEKLFCIDAVETGIERLIAATCISKGGGGGVNAPPPPLNEPLLSD